jgi:hypothetical protein
MVDVGSQRVLGFEIFRKANASRRANYEGTSNKIKVAAARRTVTIWEGD